MDEELQKRNTDCVYFLASPLTCKKGIECEYRHSEIARLNPRDCWYWLSGSCLNPTCGFRHPPLDGHPEKSSESASHYDNKTVPVNRTDVPCFFFFNGFCSKGYKCSFLHGQDETKHALKSSKSASVVSNEHLEKKILTGSDTGSTHIDTNPNPSETKQPIKPPPPPLADGGGGGIMQNKAKQELHQLAPNNIEEIRNSPRMMMMMMSASDDGDDDAERLVQMRSVISVDQSSDENVDWLESSPGFDVLVDDRLQTILGYEQDSEYLVNDQSRVYDYEEDEEEETVGYNRLFQEIPPFRDSDDELTYDYIIRNPVRAREKIRNNTLPDRKRKFLPAENGRKGVDLRDNLKKRRIVFGRSQQRHLRRQGGFSSSVEHSIGESYFKNDALFKAKQRGPFQRRGKLMRKPISKKRKINEEKTDVFTGPKSLNQIREEKKRFEKNEEDFQGPKPLSEILKDKKRSS